MCGIAGYSLRSAQAELQQLQAMATAQQHRGPDGEGFYTHQHVGLAHSRLSIIDLNGGAQPLSSQGGEWQLVANGEIYNYKKLQQQFKVNYQFKTASDCEPLIPLFAEHGATAPQHVEGMYAVAAYHQPSDTLYLARDPFGIKPLYIHQSAYGVAFASEPRALLALPWVQKSLNEAALLGVLNRQYSRGRCTLFADIERVLPGELLVVRGGEIVERQRHLPALRKAQNISQQEALEQLEERLFSSIHAHVQSDVPYGAFLSGGIDSSAMVTAMTRTLNEPVRTFTIGFADDSVADEQSTAAALAQKLNTVHSTATFGEADFWRQLDVWVQASDDLVADYAALPLLELANSAKQDVTVVLSGEGGDEILAGYGRYRRKLLAKLLGKPLRKTGPASRRAGLFTQALNLTEPLDDGYDNSGFSRLQQDQLLDISNWLPDDLLMKVDRALMWHGLEGRVPYLDNQFAAAMFALPDNLKQQGKHGKWLLKYWLDQQQVDAPVWGKKRGFTVPIKAWLYPQREKLAADWQQSAVTGPLLNQNTLQQWLQKDWSQTDALLAFRLTCLAKWGQHWLR